MTGTALATADLNQIIEDILSSFAEGVEPGPGLGALIDARSWLETFVKISGPWRGEVSLAVLSETARELTSVMMQLPADEVSTDDTVDALCELVNMIGGQVKGTLPTGCTMSLPLIRMMREAQVRPEAGDDLSTRSFVWEGHPLRVTIRAYS
jgi:chemotaxis protein CheX